MANPTGIKGPTQKPFRDALRLAISDAEGDFRKLRKVAESLVRRATKGDVQAIKEIADRLDGKVPQAIVGDDEHGPVRIEEIRRVLVAKPRDTDSGDIPTAS